MNRMRRVVRIGIIVLMLCTLTGCEAVNLKRNEGLETGMEQVYAQKESELQEEQTTPDNEKLLHENKTEMPEQMISPTASPQPLFYEFTTSEKEYFADALFIGDSRTVGLQLYGTLDNADYFATPGLNVHTISKALVPMEGENLSLEEFLEKKDYKKIYVMLGINGLGYNFDVTVERYQNLVASLQEKEPGVIIYVCANLHVTSVRDENDKIHNNEAINRINGEIAALEDRKDIFYLDINELFDDEDGNLSKEYASDDSHVLGKYYEQWCEWLREHTIIK